MRDFDLIARLNISGLIRVLVDSYLEIVMVYIDINAVIMSVCLSSV